MFTSSLRRHGLILGLLFVPSLAVAAQLPARFTLGSYVPEHAWFYVHHASNPDRAWIDQKWSEVFEAFNKTGIDKDLMTLVMSAMSSTSGPAPFPDDRRGDSNDDHIRRRQNRSRC